MATQVITAPVMAGLGRSTEWVAEHNALLLAAQRRNRRGPTPEALFTRHIDNSRLVKADDPARAREMRTFACALAFFLSLAMIYGWQHLNAIQYGYRIAADQQQLQQLQEQNRELQLTRAQLADPGRIDTLARNYGLVAPRPGQVVLPNAAVDPNPVAGGPVMAESRPAVPRVH
jgi:hypothetical protein